MRKSLASPARNRHLGELHQYASILDENIVRCYLPKLATRYLK